MRLIFDKNLRTILASAKEQSQTFELK